MKHRGVSLRAIRGDTKGVVTLNVTVRLFAGYREKAGKAELGLDLPKDATVGCLADEVVRLYPAIMKNPARLVVAVNQEYRDHGFVLSDGDEAALIPPVSGGVR